MYGTWGAQSLVSDTGEGIEAHVERLRGQRAAVAAVHAVFKGTLGGGGRRGKVEMRAAGWEQGETVVFCSFGGFTLEYGCRIDLPERRIDLPERRIDLPECRIDFPERRGDLPERLIDLPERRGDLPERRSGQPSCGNRRVPGIEVDMANSLPYSLANL